MFRLLATFWVLVAAPEGAPPGWMLAQVRNPAAGTGMMAPLPRIPHHLRPHVLPGRGHHYTYAAAHGIVLPWLVLVVFICSMAPGSIDAWVRLNHVYLESQGTRFERRNGWSIPGWVRGLTAEAGLSEYLDARGIVETESVRGYDGRRAFHFAFLARPLTTISASCDDRIDAAAMRLFGSEWAGMLLKTSSIFVSASMLSFADVVWLPPSSTLDAPSVDEFRDDPSTFEWQLAVGLNRGRCGRVHMVVWLQRSGVVPEHLGRLLRAMAASNIAVASVAPGGPETTRMLPPIVIYYGPGDDDGDYTCALQRALEHMVGVEHMAQAQQPAMCSRARCNA